MKKALSAFISYHSSLFAQLPGYVGVYTTGSQIAYCNLAHAMAMGFKDELSFCGCAYEDIRAPTCELAKTFKARDRQVIASLSEVSYLSYAKNQSQDWRLYLGTKKPIFDGQNNLMGILSLSTDMTDKQLVDITCFFSDTGKSLPKRAQFSYTINDQVNGEQLNLSKRQLECLYYLIRGRSLKEIAQLLGLSHRTVETYINYIKTKWQCQSIRELIQKGIYLGCMNIIPESIFERVKIKKH